MSIQHGIIDVYTPSLWGTQNNHLVPCADGHTAGGVILEMVVMVS